MIKKSYFLSIPHIFPSRFNSVFILYKIKQNLIIFILKDVEYSLFQNTVIAGVLIINIIFFCSFLWINRDNAGISGDTSVCGWRSEESTHWFGSGFTGLGICIQHQILIHDALWLDVSLPNLSLLLSHSDESFAKSLARSVFSFRYNSTLMYCQPMMVNEDQIQNNLKNL